MGHLDKHWVANVLYSLDASGISDMIYEALEKRKVKLEENRHLLVDMKPEFASALESCQTFSCKYSSFSLFFHRT